MNAATPRIALTGLFVTALVTAQVTASKLIGVGLGGLDLPVVGGTIILPGAAVAYAFTFLASDCYSELYGEDEARTLVLVGFALNFVLLGFVWLTIYAPYAGGVDPAAFESVLGASSNIVAGSLVAYLVSQNTDVSLFHYLRRRTDGDRLWLRNVVSTSVSQGIDTLLFVGIAFAVAPAVLGVGQVLPAAVLVQLAIGQYLLKVAIALGDTPLVYAVVGYVRGGDHAAAVAPSD